MLTIVSGGPKTGKTTLVKELNEKGFKTYPKRDVDINCFMDELLGLQMEDLSQINNNGFSDESIIDTCAHLWRYPTLDLSKYNKLVFFIDDDTPITKKIKDLYILHGFKICLLPSNQKVEFILGIC